MILPQFPAIIEHLDQLSGQFDILLRHRPMNRQSAYGTNSLFQLTVHGRTNFTVTQLQHKMQQHQHQKFKQTNAKALQSLYNNMGGGGGMERYCVPGNDSQKR